jgi:hypothetical protein
VPAAHGDEVNRKPAWVLCVIALVAGMMATAVCYQSRLTLRELRIQMVADELQPIAALLHENQGIIAQLEAEPFIEKGSGILESYLAKIRRDGVPKNAEMKQRLDQLAENNTAIVTLIKAYSPHAKTAEFKSEADKFQHYAIAWRDRWNSVMELFMAGGNYPAAGIPFPNEFPRTVRSELAAASTR